MRQDYVGEGPPRPGGGAVGSPPFPARYTEPLRDVGGMMAGQVTHGAGVLPIGGLTSDGAVRLSPSNLAWQLDLMSRKVRGLRIVDDLTTLNEHAKLDLLVACRNSLQDGGILHGVENLYRGSDAERCAERLGSVGLKPGVCDLFGREFRCLATKPAEFVPNPGGFARKIYVLGDSHCLFLGGRNEYDPGNCVDDRFGLYENLTSLFTALHLGPGLAANLLRVSTTAKIREKTLYVLERGYVPRNGRILFSFGEIDCRYHVVRQVEAQARPVESIVQAICATYLGFLDVIAGAGYRVGIWAPFATSWRTEHEYHEYPILGSYEFRDHAMRLFNSIMRDGCRRRGYDFLSVFERVHGPDGQVDRRYFHDYIHLSQAARPLLHDLLPDG